MQISNIQDAYEFKAELVRMKHDMAYIYANGTGYSKIAERVDELIDNVGATCDKLEAEMLAYYGVGG